MPFVKLDTNILRSTIWADRDGRDLFLTVLLMAEPKELREPMPQLRVHSLDATGFVVPPGWYGFAEASGPGVATFAGVPWNEASQAALARLGEPDPLSRSSEWEGRRVVRVDGGFIVLNYMRYRERDYTNADRQRRWRERHKGKTVEHNAVSETTSPRYITQAEAEAEAEVEATQKTPHTPHGGDDVATTTAISRTKMGHAGASRFDRFWSAYPLKHGKGAAMRAWDKLKPTEQMTDLMIAAIEQQKTWRKWREGFVPNPATWLNQQCWLDEPEPARENPKSRTAGNADALRAVLERRRTT